MLGLSTPARISSSCTIFGFTTSTLFSGSGVSSEEPKDPSTSVGTGVTTSVVSFGSVPDKTPSSFFFNGLVTPIKAAKASASPLYPVLVNSPKPSLKASEFVDIRFLKSAFAPLYPVFTNTSYRSLNACSFISKFYCGSIVCSSVYSSTNFTFCSLFVDQFSSLVDNSNYISSYSFFCVIIV